MNLATLKENLRTHGQLGVRLVLPEGDPIPEDFHVTEVGHVVKTFIDCGGLVHRSETCLLQAWVSAKDTGHRISADKLAKILDLAAEVVPSGELEVEVEYGSCSAVHYTIDRAGISSDELTFHLAEKHTDCLARDACGLAPESAGCGCGNGEGGCC